MDRHAQGTKRGVQGRSAGTGALLVLCAALLFLNVPAPAAQGNPDGGKLTADVERQIRAAGADDLLSVIIQTVDEPSPSHFARLHGRGGVVKVRHESVHGYTARVPASQIEALADDPEVTHVSYDSPVKAHMDIAYKAVRADAAFTVSGGLTGKGVAVAVVDTGVASHADLLRPRGLPQVMEVEVVGHENGLADYYGHGTHVAGIIGGSGAASSDPASFRTFKGIAPGVQILSIRALSPDGTGYTSDILTAIDWAIRFKTTYNIRVLNLSLGHPIYESYKSDPLCQAVRKATQAGILVVVAAGNDGGVGSGFGTITSPANEPTAVTVGAMDDSNTVTTTDDVLGWYSSKGPTLIDFVVKPDLVAPGSAIVSLRSYGSYLDTHYHDLALHVGDYRNDPPNALKDGDYYALSGTSMSAPMVSGAAALLLQKDPTLTPATVKARLMVSALKDHRLIFETGAGFLDVEAALKATVVAADASSPRALLAADGNVYIENTSIIWGGGFTLSLIWGAEKGFDAGLRLLDVPDSLVSVDGGIWGGRAGSHALIENNQITSSGLIWGGDRCLLDSTTGLVDNMGGIWGGGGRKP